MKYLSLFFGLLLACGCSGNVPLSGKVTFSDDGSPLTTGMVFFESDTAQARGQLDADGNYRLGSVESTDGLKPGTYRVYINGALIDNPNAQPGTAPPLPLLDLKYDAGNTSGITVDVDRSTRRYDFTVDRNMNTKAILDKAKK